MAPGDGGPIESSHAVWIKLTAWRHSEVTNRLLSVVARSGLMD